jgi:hypothetical protein
VEREWKISWGGRGANWLFWLLATAFAAHFVWLHVRAGYTFPTPWTDEVAYLWQGIALGRSGSPVAPELVADVHLMWIPPGFMLVNAAFFRLFGFSLDLARWMSAGEVLVCFAALCAIARRLRAPWVSLLLCGLFLWSSRFVMAGNIGRMEALVLAFVGPGLLLLARGRWVSGLAITACSALVHPNGVFFTGGVALFLLIQPRRFTRLAESDRRQWIVFALVVCAFVGYGVYVLTQWDAFVAQMGAQFGRKMERELLQTLGRPSEWSFLLLFMGIFGWSFRRSERASLLSCFALGGWLTCLIGLEWWYEVNRSLGFLLLCLAGIDLVLGLDLPERTRSWAAPAAAGIALVALWGTGVLPFPPGDPSRLKAIRLKILPEWQRVDREDFALIAERMRPWTECGKPVVVRVYPRGDSLLLYEELGGETSVLFSSPPYVFRNLGREDERYVPPRWDAFVIHLTHDLVPFTASRRNAAFIDSGIDPTSQEHLVQFDGPASHWYMRVRRMRVLTKCWGPPRE